MPPPPDEVSRKPKQADVSTIEGKEIVTPSLSDAEKSSETRSKPFIHFNENKTYDPATFASIAVKIAAEDGTRTIHKPVSKSPDKENSAIHSLAWMSTRNRTPSPKPVPSTIVSFSTPPIKDYAKTTTYSRPAPFSRLTGDNLGHHRWFEHGGGENIINKERTIPIRRDEQLLASPIGDNFFLGKKPHTGKKYVINLPEHMQHTRPSSIKFHGMKIFY